MINNWRSGRGVESSLLLLLSFELSAAHAKSERAGGRSQHEEISLAGCRRPDGCVQRPAAAEWAAANSGINAHRIRSYFGAFAQRLDHTCTVKCQHAHCIQHGQCCRTTHQHHQVPHRRQWLSARATPSHAGCSSVNNFEPATRIGGLLDQRTYTKSQYRRLTFRTTWVDIEPAQDNFISTKLDTVFTGRRKEWQMGRIGIDSGLRRFRPGRCKACRRLRPLPSISCRAKGSSSHCRCRGTDISESLVRVPESRERPLPECPSFLKVAADGRTSVTRKCRCRMKMRTFAPGSRLATQRPPGSARWQQVFSNDAQIFPRQYFSLALYPPPPIVSKTRCQNGSLTGTTRTRASASNGHCWVRRRHSNPKQFVLQTMD